MERVINTKQGVTNKAELKVPACPVPPSIKSKTKIIALKVTGIFFVGIAILGAILPILPTTVFLIIAAACFAKSSPEMERKLLANKTFGPLIIEWRKHKKIPRKAKRIALLTMIFSVCLSSYLLQSLLLTLVVIGLIIGPFIYVARLPENE